MPKIFPYNLFTMKKLIKREVFSKRVGDMTKQQEELFEVLKKGIEETLPSQRAEFAKRVEEWKEHKRAEEAAGGTGGGGGGGGFGGPVRQKTPEVGARAGFGEASPAIGTPLLGAAGGGEGASGSPAPGKDGELTLFPFFFSFSFF